MVVDDLYGGPEALTKYVNSVELPFDLSDAIKSAFKSLYRHHNTPEDLLPQELLQGITDTLNAAISEDFQRDYPEFTQLIKDNNQVFAAFKVHDQSKRMVDLLLDDEGELKSFQQWVKDAEPISKHHNKVWLKTEYDTAVKRAIQARDWQQYEAEKDVLPNLRWVPSTAAKPRADHMVFWDTVLPVDHPFWNAHRPGDKWGCQCSLEATDDGIKEPPSDGGEQDQPSRGLENNPGKDGKLFSDKHPYMPASCSSCPFNTGTGHSGPQNAARNCATCVHFLNCVGDPDKSNAAIERKHYMVEMEHLLKKKISKQAGSKTINVGFTKEGNKHLYSDTHGRSSVLKKDNLKSLDKVLSASVYDSDAALTHPRADDIQHFYYFIGKIRGKKVRLNVAKQVRRQRDGYIRETYFLYSINDL